MYKHTGIGWISVQEKCLRIVSFLGTKSELMNVSVMWMVTLCHGGKSGYKNSCNKIVIQLSFSRHIAVWEGHLMLYVCYKLLAIFLMQVVKFYEKYRNIYWEQKESHTIFPCLSILFNVNVVPALYFFFCRRWQGFPFTVSLSDFLCLLCIVGVRRPRRIRSGQRANGS